MANDIHTDFRGWDTDFSTRQSVHPFDRFKAFNATATSTTAANLFTTGRNAVGTRPAVNLVTNPRLGSSTISMFTASGSTLTHSTDQQSLGTHSLKVDPANSAADEGFYWTSPTVNLNVHKDQWITVQCEHRGASASGAVTLEIMNSSGSALATSGTDSLAASWKRLTAVYRIPAGTAGATYRLSLTTTAQHNINFYADKIMFEVREDGPNVSSYVDGDNGPDHFWESTQNASKSFRKGGMSLIKGLTLKNDSSDAAEIVYVAFDSTASATNGIKVAAGGTLDTTNFALGFNERISVISASGTPTVTGVVWGTHYE